jgi:hypothetical protein
MLYVRTIAEEASCSERQVRRALSTLEARHLLIRRPQNVAGQGQTFNIYEVYGFDEYYPGENPAENDDAEPPCQPVTPPMTDRQAPACQPVTPPLPVSPATPDSQAGFNNVFEQPLFNSSKKEHIPPTPQQETGNGKTSEHENQKPEHDTGRKTENPEPNAPSPNLHGLILSAYNETLQKLPTAEKLTASRTKALNLRIREATARNDPEWWKRYFRSVRDYPWLMGIEYIFPDTSIYKQGINIQFLQRFTRFFDSLIVS